MPPRGGRCAMPSRLALLFFVTFLALPLASANYTCSTTTCLGSDNCVCASTTPPGGLGGSAIPQFIVLTNDDTVTETSLELVLNITERHRNPNLCKIPATWFVTAEGTNATLLERLYTSGHSIATNGYSLKAGATVQDIIKGKLWLNQTGGIPLEDIKGFRAPYQLFSPEQRRALRDNGFLYDSSITEVFGTTTSPSLYRVLFPYTMDYGIPQNCTLAKGVCYSNETYPGLWEVPVWETYWESTRAGPLDPAVSDWYTLYRTMLAYRLSSNRAPLGVYLHASWLDANSNHTDQLNRFFDWALEQDGVYVVTMEQLIDWMSDPVAYEDYEPECPNSMALLERLADPVARCVQPNTGCYGGTWSSSTCTCTCTNADDDGSAGYCLDANGACTVAKEQDLLTGSYYCPVNYSPSPDVDVASEAEFASATDGRKLLAAVSGSDVSEGDSSDDLETGTETETEDEEDAILTATSAKNTTTTTTTAITKSPSPVASKTASKSPSPSPVAVKATNTATKSPSLVATTTAVSSKSSTEAEDAVLDDEAEDDVDVDADVNEASSGDLEGAAAPAPSTFASSHAAAPGPSASILATALSPVSAPSPAAALASALAKSSLGYSFGSAACGHSLLTFVGLDATGFDSSSDAYAAAAKVVDGSCLTCTTVARENGVAAIYVEVAVNSSIAGVRLVSSAAGTVGVNVTNSATGESAVCVKSATLSSSNKTPVVANCTSGNLVGDVVVVYTTASAGLTLCDLYPYVTDVLSDTVTSQSTDSQSLLGVAVRVGGGTLTVSGSYAPAICEFLVSLSSDAGATCVVHGVQAVSTATNSRRLLDSPNVAIAVLYLYATDAGAVQTALNHGTDVAAQLYTDGISIVPSFTTVLQTAAQRKAAEEDTVTSQSVSPSPSPSPSPAEARAVSPSPSPSISPSPSSASTKNLGAIVGGAVGGGVGGALVLGLAVFYFVRRRCAARAGLEAESSTDTTATTDSDASVPRRARRGPIVPTRHKGTIVEKSSDLSDESSAGLSEVVSPSKKQPAEESSSEGARISAWFAATGGNSRNSQEARQNNDSDGS